MIKVDLGKKLPAELVEQVANTMKAVVNEGRISDLTAFLANLDPKTDDLLSTPLMDLGYTADDFGIKADSWSEVAQATVLQIARSNAEIDRRVISK